MSIIISKHTRGVLITEDTDNRALTLSILRQTINSPVSQLSRNQFLIPLEFAFSLIEGFPPDSCVWSEEIFRIAEEQQEHRDAQLHAHMEVSFTLENALQELHDYRLVDRLDSHQIEAVAAISIPSLRGIAIFDEQGTGKTVMGLCGFDRLTERKLIDRLCIIAPKSVLGGWKNDAEMLFEHKYKFNIVTGTPKERRRIILNSHDILALSYETAVSQLALLRAVLSLSTKYMLIVDESYYVKNENAQRTKAVLELRASCARAVVLCGTPAPNSPKDIVQQINIADKGLTFNNQVFNSDDSSELYSQVAKGLENAIYLRRLKHEVLPDLPKKNIERVEFELQPIQKQLYETAHQNLVLDVQKVDDTQFTKQLTSFMARQTALLQICSNPGVLSPSYEETPAKHLALDRLLKEIVEKEDSKVVIWSYYRFSLQALADRYQHYGVVRIDGTVTELNQRIDAIKRFQRDNQIKIFFGNAAAAGAGITLTAAHHAIYESFSNQAAHYMQSVDRIHRRGQTQTVMIHVLLAHDTIEGKMFDRLIEKEKTGRALLGDVYEEPMTRERFLAELTG